jgi:hypothetical protein
MESAPREFGFVGLDMKNSSRGWSLHRRIRNLLLFLLSVALLGAGPVFAQGCFPSFGPPCAWPCGGVSASVGYFGQKQGFDISFSNTGQAAGSLTGLRQQIDLGGIEIALALPFRGSGPAGFLVGADYRPFFTKPSEETVQNAGAATRTRTWEAKPQNFDIFFAVTMDFYPTLTGVAGFRYENFEVNFINPSTGFGSPQGLFDSAAISLNAYVPYLGLVLHNAAGGLGFDAQFGVMASPVVLGTINYRETVDAGLVIGGATAPGFSGYNSFRSGYYLEAFADSSFTTAHGIQLGAYVKYYATQATSTIHTGESSATVPQIDYKCDLLKRSWGVGGRVCLFF